MAHLEQQILMGHAGPLRPARGARCVDQHGGIRGGAAGDPVVQNTRIALQDHRARLKEILQRAHHRVFEPAQARPVKDIDAPHPRQPVPHLQILVQLLFVFHKQDGRRGIRQRILKLAGLIGGINPVDHAAGQQDAHIGKDPLLVGLGQDRGHIALLKPLVHQSRADLAGRCRKIGPAMGFPDPQFLFAHGDAVAPLRHARAEQFGDAVMPVDGDDTALDAPVHHAHLQVLRIFQRFSPRTPASDSPR